MIRIWQHTILYYTFIIFLEITVCQTLKLLLLFIIIFHIRCGYFYRNLLGVNMRIKDNDKDINIKQLGREVKRFLNITGENIWKEKIVKLDEHLRSKNTIFYEEYLKSRNPFLKSLKEFFDLYDSGKSIWRNASDELKKAGNRIISINRIFHSVNNVAKGKIKSALLADSITPFLFEIQIATHFLVHNWDVEFVDLERKNQNVLSYDFLVKKKSFELEIECIRISADKGRKITREGFYSLCDKILSQVEPLGGKYIFTIKCKDRLGKNISQFQKLATLIRENIENLQYSVNLDGISVNIYKLPNDFKKNNRAIALLEPYIKNHALHNFYFVKGVVFIFRAESEKKNKVLKSIYETMKDGAEQFSGTKAAILACFIEDIEESSWNELRKDSGLANMTKRFFTNVTRNHISKVIFSSEPIFRKVNNFLEYSSENLIFGNLNCKYSVPSDIFR